MKFMKEPVNFEKESYNYLVIGYFNGKAIVKNEMYHLYFIVCEEEQAPIGTVVTAELIEPIEKLKSAEQQQIQDIYGNKDN